ncbi:Gamma-glutamylputrescine oxidoreductase [Thalassovita gelatinovora]|uniref:Gamma-glutamylputrescine oxidoreductase n=1 Tax=Thalassovita gelatinovora TaxID=53501 RepID=A0A0P1FIH4_THAGE|nr:FAD-binding oxidoreductase [Thalassovita gelatinovora]QIZ82132.1 FAD-binding oxidoreductase [Thalassovita gelatinovora]CUH67707.1 Gamma-glutamylputrescine oxidoreductase [Thalassovita gelatinovora]SEP68981.1 gamma-glutamylputrescine oxidase [Thalassovita gelatinovora]
MNLLYSNDKMGQYPESWYAATSKPLDPLAALKGETRADVCVVGGGFTGLSAALHLAEAGFDVVLLEAQRVGFGASGRNGGQLGSGQRRDQEELEAMLGQDAAHRLWDLGEEAKQLVRDLVAKHGIDCDLKPGVAWTGFGKRDTTHLHHYAEKLQRDYGYDQVSALSPQEWSEICPSPAYDGAMLDMGAGHLHPLNFALGLARAAINAGVRIYEQTPVQHVEQGTKPVLTTEHGKVTCNHVILACNGYLGGLNRDVAKRVMPINNFVAATEPLGAEGAKVLTRDIAVCDSKFVVNYYRMSADGRLLFGGGESYGYRFPRDITALLHKPMTEIYPHLKDVRIDYAWGGTLAITMKRLPFVARVAPNILNASGYSGHGLGTATHCGMVMAKAIQGDAEGFDTMSALPAPGFPGGPAFRSPLLVLAMSWFALRDRLGL